MSPVEAVAARVLAEHIDGPCDDPRCHLYRRHGVGPLCEHLAAEIAAALRADEGLAEAMWDAIDAQHYRGASHYHAGDCCWPFPQAARVALDAITRDTTDTGSAT